MKTVNILQVTENLNKARIAAGNRVFSKDLELKSFLSEHGIKIGTWYVFNEIRKLLKDGRFPEYPIHKDRVKAIYDAAKRSRKEAKSELPKIEEAISLLKQAGYKILKPVTNYEEV